MRTQVAKLDIMLQHCLPVKQCCREVFCFSRDWKLGHNSCWIVQPHVSARQPGTTCPMANSTLWVTAVAAADNDLENTLLAGCEHATWAHNWRRRLMGEELDRDISG